MHASANRPHTQTVHNNVIHTGHTSCENVAANLFTFANGARRPTPARMFSATGRVVKLKTGCDSTAPKCVRPPYVQHLDVVGAGPRPPVNVQ